VRESWRQRQRLDPDNAETAAELGGARRNLTGEVDVVVPDRGVVDRLAQVGAVDEHVEVTARVARLAVVDDTTVVARRQVDAETPHRCVDIGYVGSEERDVVVASEHLGDRAVHLLASAERRPVEVVHAHPKT
jgi:hypothetical protein